MKNSERMIKHVGSVSTATMISRITGFLRDALVAYLFGATAYSDAFYAAFRISNLFRRLFGEGAFSSAFIPVFSSYHKDDTVAEKHFARVTTGNLLSIVFFLTILGVIASPVLVRILAFGFIDNPEQYSLAVLLTRIMFPYVMFISLASCVMGVLQTYSIFFVPALAAVAFNLSAIGYVTVIVPVLGTAWTLPQLTIGLAVSVVVGGIGEWLWMVPSYVKKGFSIIPSLNFTHPGVLRVFRLMIPSMMGISIDQVNMFISATFLASFLSEGSVTALYYADRLTQLPLALFGLSVVSVALPLMSRAAAEKQKSEIIKTLNFSVRIIGFLVIPSAVGLIVLGIPIIQVLFQRGVFDVRATQLTYRAMVPFAIGSVSLSLVKIFASVFYSLQDTKRPVIVASCCMGFNVVLSIVLMHFFDIAGLASASALSSTVNAIILAMMARKKVGLLGGKNIMKTYMKIMTASCMMGAAVFAVMQTMSRFHTAVQVASGIGVGLFVYIGASVLLHISERKYIFSMFQRRILPDESL